MSHTVFGRLLLVLLVGLGWSLSSLAQNAAPNLVVRARVVDAGSGKPIVAASAELYGADSLLAGGLSDAAGTIELRARAGKDLKLIVSVLGYREGVFAIAADARGTADLGTLKLEASATELQNVVVTAAKPLLQMGIDRKIFTADRAITAKGGTAVDMLRNIPSVTVDADGSVQMRNASPQIFVDGRPTILTLDQIPADDIETVELITNPGSKYDASSAGGIINIVLKKNRRRGMNGNASVGVGTPGITTGNFGINLRQGPVNFFATLNHNGSGGRAAGSSDRTTLENGLPKEQFSQQTWTDRRRRFQSARFGVDWFMDKYNTVSVSQGFTTGRFGWDEVQTQRFATAAGDLLRTGDREAIGSFRFDRASTQVNYRRTFDKKGQELTADVTYNAGEGRGASDIVNLFFNPNGAPIGSPNMVTDNSSNESSQLTVQVDYVNPVGENGKFEAGLRTFSNQFESRFNTFRVQPGGALEKLPLSNFIRYTEQVHAGYVNYGNKSGKWSYQGGLRMELSSFDGELPDSARQFGYRYPDGFRDILNGLFPSAFVTYSISDKQQVQLNYSRRIRRPNFWQLNPFVDITDPLNIRQGNLNLRPETTHAFEANFSHAYKKGSLLAVVYFHNNVDDITQFSDTLSAAQWQQLNNAAIDPGAILNTFVNADYTNRLGTEFTLTHKAGENFEITPTVNLQYRKVKASIGDQDLGNEGFNWQGKLMVNYKLPSEGRAFWQNWAVQFMGEYESPRVIPQGRRLAEYGMDLALRKDFLRDKKATVVLAVNDVFDTRRRGTWFRTPTFEQESFSRWNVRSFRITLSYKFGRSDLQLFQRKPANDGGGGGMEG